MTKLAKETKSKIERALPGSKIIIEDFSHEHLNHGAPGAHIAVTVTHDSFKDLPLVKQHQVIYKILSDEIKKQVIHALRIRTKSE